jgi:deazaflavin-dependent oxidoreductase (nitroreductase family)
MDQRRFRTALAKYTLNPVVKLGAALGVHPPGVVVIETTGRKTGKARRNPVGARRDGDTLWVVAEHGRKASYVRNIMANPHVRVRMRGRWHSGVARPMPEDDPRQRLRMMERGKPGLRLNNVFTRLMATDPMTVRIDLDPR